jgi:hypothetical protein
MDAATISPTTNPMGKVTADTTIPSMNAAAKRFIGAAYW